MNKDNKFEELLVSLQKEDLDIIDKLKEMVAFIRPSHLNKLYKIYTFYRKHNGSIINLHRQYEPSQKKSHF